MRNAYVFATGFPVYDAE